VTRGELALRIRKWTGTLLLVVAFLFILSAFMAPIAGAETADPPAVPLPVLNIGVGQGNTPVDVVNSLQIIALLTILSLAPSILIMTTAFSRIIIVLSFTRNALSTQNMPPNQVLIGLALFLTFFIMAPTWNRINTEALQPYLSGELAQAEALERGSVPLREFMLRHAREQDLGLFLNLAGLPRPETPDDKPTFVLIPAFAVSEITTAFRIGFLIFVPFVVIDMVVAATLMSMGFLMLPPVLISLPFKILLFVMVDGWRLIVQYLVTSFQG